MAVTIFDKFRSKFLTYIRLINISASAIYIYHIIFGKNNGDKTSDLPE